MIVFSSLLNGHDVVVLAHSLGRIGELFANNSPTSHFLTPRAIFQAFHGEIFQVAVYVVRFFCGPLNIIRQ